MFVKVTLIPRRTRTAESFEARDPWNGSRPASFRVEVYKLIPAHVTDPRDWRDGTVHTLGAKELYGIRSELDGVERRLPTFLADAYAAGQVPAARLPELLSRVERELDPKDFRPVPGKGSRDLALAGLLLVVLAAAGFRAIGGNVPRTALTIVTTDAWLAKPVVPGETYAVNGMVPLEGTIPAPSGLVVPDGVARSAGRSFSIGWTRSGNGHRALLLPERRYERNGQVEVGFAAILAPSEVGLAVALGELRARVPDLDTSAVAASRWIGGARRDPREGVRIAALLAGFLGLVLAAGFGTAYLLGTPRRRRNRSFLERLVGGVVAAPR